MPVSPGAAAPSTGGTGLPLGPDGWPWTSTTEPGPVTVDPARWSAWWDHNGDAYLELGRLIEGVGTLTGADASGSGLTRSRIEDQVLPALNKVLLSGGDVELMRNTMFSIARMAPREAQSRRGIGLDHFAHHYLKGDLAEMQEASILALGVSGQPKNIPFLVHVLDDDAEGREAAGGPVSVRNRAFAAFALGALGLRTLDQDLRLSIVHSLIDALGNERTATREIQVACVLATGLVGLEFCGDDPEKLERHKMEGDRHLCGGVQLRYLLDIFRDGELDPWVRAHVAPALGRLGANAPDDFKSAVVEELVRCSSSKSREEDYIRHGCAIGLGLVADGDEDELDGEARKALLKLIKKGDPQTQRFAMISLAKAASKPGSSEDPEEADGLLEARATLLRLLARGKGDRKGWAALALGVLGHGGMQANRVVSPELGTALRSSLRRASTPEEIGACVLGLAMLRDENATKEVFRAFERAEDESLKCLASRALGLVSADESVDTLRELLDDPEQSLRLQLELAVALRLLGETDAAPLLLARLDESVEALERIAIIETLGTLDDPRATAPLIAVLGDEGEQKGVRAAASKALGDICAESSLPWTSSFSCDLNYNLLTWTLSSPFGDGGGLLDLR